MTKNDIKTQQDLKTLACADVLQKDVGIFWWQRAGTAV